MAPRDNPAAAAAATGEKRPVVTYRYIRGNTHLLDPDDPIFFTWGMRNKIAQGMCLLSFVYAVLSLYILLWRIPGDQPLTWVCTFSLLACSYMFFWIISLSEAITKLAAFTGITYGILLALAAGQLIWFSLWRDETCQQGSNMP